MTTKIVIHIQSVEPQGNTLAWILGKARKYCEDKNMRVDSTEGDVDTIHHLEYTWEEDSRGGQIQPALISTVLGKKFI